ncbi:MAG: ATP-grasp domain-containing protein [Candidatus Dormibacteria bacterium]
MAPRVMLVLPTHTYRAAPFLEAAARLGLEVVVASNEASSLAAFMHGRQLTLDLGHPEQSAAAAAELARHHPLAAVVGVDETSVLTAAHVAAGLGLRHNAVAAVEATRDKARMRRLLAAAAVPQPAHVEIAGSHVAAAVATVSGSAPAPVDAAASGDGRPAVAVGEVAMTVEQAGRDVGFPCVVKPVSLSGSRGVIRADDEPELLLAARRARALCGDEAAPLLVEAFVGGPEVAVEGLLTAGRLDVIAVFDKPDPLEGPYFEETLYVRPSRLPPDGLQGIGAVTAEATRALGLTEGPVHAELRLGDRGPVVIEVAARSIGGLCSQILTFGSGITLEEVILRHAVGAPMPSLRPAGTATGVLMIPIPGRGTLRSVTGIDEVRSLPGLDSVSITIPPGEEVVPLPEGDRYLGFLFASGPTPEAVERDLRAAHSRLTITIDP